jgi:DNA-binding response OmpR family regulator
MPSIESDTLTVASPTHETYLSELAEVPGPERIPKVLSISPISEDHQMLQCILNGFCQICEVVTCREAADFLCRDRVAIIFCERDLPDGTWKDILSYTAELADPPALIVTSSLADEHLWAEVLNMGGYDVLAKPFRQSEVKYALAGLLTIKASPRQRALTSGDAGL